MSNQQNTPGPFEYADNQTHGMLYGQSENGRYAVAEVFDEENGGLFKAAPDLLKLAERVARLNAKAGEIGEGMLASLVE